MNLTETDAVLATVEDRVATLQLNRPPMNPFDDELRESLIACVREVADNPDIRACVIHGGAKHFAAGADIKALAAMGYEDIVTWNARLHGAFNAVAALPMPVVAAINGYALGGGLELALAADIRIGSTNSTLGLPEIKLGILPGAGGTQRLTQIVGRSTAKLLMMSGRHVPAHDALRLGVLDEIAAPGETIDRAQDLARELAAAPHLAIQSIKACIDAALPQSAAGLALERASLAGTFATDARTAAMHTFLDRARPTTRPNGPRN